MDSIKLAATATTPEVDFDFRAGRFSVAGESYSDDAAKLLDDLAAQLKEYFGGFTATKIAFTWSLIYFNSSSARRIVRILHQLDRVAQGGLPVTVTWTYRPHDESIREFGEEFCEELDHAEFVLQAKDA